MSLVDEVRQAAEQSRRICEQLARILPILERAERQGLLGDGPATFSDAAEAPAIDYNQDLAPAPEEAHPASPAAEDISCLRVQLCDGNLHPLGAIAYALNGPGLLLRDHSSAHGIIDLIGCGRGVYTLIIEGQSYSVPSLLLSDFDSDPEPYRLVVRTHSGRAS